MNIVHRIDRLPNTPMLRKILFLTGIGWMFDAMDQGMVSGVIAAIGSDWALTKGQVRKKIRNYYDADTVWNCKFALGFCNQLFYAVDPEIFNRVRIRR